MGTYLSTLVITDSWDTTADLIIERIGDQAFRLNSDLIRDYDIEWGPSGFSVVAPGGREIHSERLKNVYWRKPFSGESYKRNGTELSFYFEECRYCIREMLNWCREEGANCLVEPGAELRLGKLLQLNLAKRYFTVPHWAVRLSGDTVAPANTIAKSLSGEQLNDEMTLYTSRVSGHILAGRHIWFTQKEVDKRADITSVYVDGKIFSFSLAQKDENIDWRERLGTICPEDWCKTDLGAATNKAIQQFMKDSSLRFGRVDFAECDGDLFFLEVNPNGQWAWLDLEDKHGLLSAMVSAILGLNGAEDQIAGGGRWVF